MNSTTSGPKAVGQNGDCAVLPELKRLNYFYGQMLGARDFQAEQDYVRDKLRLHNRCLHGHGVVCGLPVTPEPMEKPCETPGGSEQARIRAELSHLIEEAKASKDPDKVAELRTKIEELSRKLENLPEDPCPPPPARTKVRVGCGFAVDGLGNELLVRHPLVVDLWAALSEADRRRVNDGERTLYLTLCYCEVKTDPARPVVSYDCGVPADCAFGRVRESVRVKVTVDAPPADHRCDPCCVPCGQGEAGGDCADHLDSECCVLIGRIVDFEPGRPLAPEKIQDWVRRMLTPYALVTITGISWSHGASYAPDEARKILGTGDPAGGVEIRFSRPVLTSTLRPGVVEIWVVEGGRGRSGAVYHMTGEYVDLPNTPTTDRVRYRQTSGESLQHGDRVLVIVRGSFILDECCRALDGDHLGGRVPVLHEYADNRRGTPPDVCVHPPRGKGPWTSGNGTEGGTFESWFYIDAGYGYQEIKR